MLDDRTTGAFGSWQISCLVRLLSRVFQLYLFVSYPLGDFWLQFHERIPKI